MHQIRDVISEKMRELCERITMKDIMSLYYAMYLLFRSRTGKVKPRDLMLLSMLSMMTEERGVEKEK